MFGSKSASTGLVRYNGIQVQSSLVGAPITLGWGRGRIKCNLIWYGDFKSVAKKQTAGKGGGSTTSYAYYASFIAGLCEGPIQGIRTVYQNSSVWTGSNALRNAKLGGAMLGQAGQAPWGYMTSQHPDQARGYSSTAYVYASNFSLGSSPTMPNFTFEVDFAIQAGSGPDANPKDIATDYLTNPQYGLPSWTASFNADWGDWANYCTAAGLLLSPVEESQRAASDFLTEILLASNSDACWSEGALKIRPYGDQEITGNGVTWTPDLTPVFDLTEDDLLPDQDGPVQLQILDQSDAYNMVQVEYLNRATNYASEIAQAQDIANIDRYGRRTQNPTTIHSICDAQVAQQVTQLLLQRSLYRRDVYSFKLAWNTDILEPLDYLTLTTTTDGLKLNRQLVQIIEIEEDDGGIKSIKAEGVAVGSANAALYSTHSGSGYQPNADVAPGSVSPPLIFNPPTSLITAGNEVWIAAGSTSPTWGGCEVWVSADNVSYAQVGVITGAARYGVLTAALPSHADPDDVDTLSVDLSTSLGALTSATAAEAAAGATLSLVGAELVGFETATLTGANAYDLTGLRRGMQATAPGAHAIGDHFARLDDAIFKYPYSSLNVGSTIYVKLPSFNLWGRATEDISTVPAYTAAVAPATALPDQVTGLALAHPWNGSTLSVVCDPSARAENYKFRFYDVDETTLLREVVTTTPSASYTASLAAQDGVRRAYAMEVIASNAAGDASPSSWLSVSNSAPPAVTSPSIPNADTTIVATCDASADPDLAGYLLFYSATSGFNPSNEGYVVSCGIPSIPLYGLAAGTYFGRIAAYDGWSGDPAFLNLSSEISFTVAIGGGSTPSGGGSGGGGGGGWTGGGGGHLNID